MTFSQKRHKKEKLGWKWVAKGLTDAATRLTGRLKVVDSGFVASV